MATCKQCDDSSLTWRKTEDDRWKLAEKSGEYHECKLMTVPLYHKMTGEFAKDAEKYPILALYREERVAFMAVNICVQQGLNPYLTEWERAGDFLRIKKAVRA